MKKAASRFAITILLLSLLLMTVFLFQPEWITSSVSRLAPGVLYSVSIQEPYVALTIDDSPDGETTPKLLDVLEENNARATFFLITNNIKDNEQIVQQILDEGHEIANHMTEDEITLPLPNEEFEEKLQEADEILNIYAETKWFRPGSGLYDQDMLDIAKSYGYQTVLGTVHPLDPQIPSATFSSWYVKQNTKPGSIIILHDCGSRGERTTAALAEILPNLVDQGYQIVTLSELVELAEEGK
jgi:peptidoglycan/xylan/chitin deacetylase (PgdA/CDA1 family)